MLFFIVGALGYWVSDPAPVDDQPRFEAHEFAVFRSDFETLRSQKVSRRAEHFQSLIDVTQSVKLTPGMTDALSEFCHQVVSTESEAPEIRAAAERALLGIQSRTEANRKVAEESPAVVVPVVAPVVHTSRKSH
jgi:hypothetical protein